MEREKKRARDKNNLKMTTIYNQQNRKEKRSKSVSNTHMYTHLELGTLTKPKTYKLLAAELVRKGLVY